MRSLCVSLLLVAALAVPARAGCGPAPAEEADQARAELQEVAAQLERVRLTLAAEKMQLAEAEEAYRRKVKALERELAAVRAERLEKVRRLAHMQAQLEGQLARLKPLAEKPPPAAKGRGAEDKLDLILKKLDDLERRLRKLEGKR
jgi:curli biogenesis system outer membrane secretion channel CsgG